MENVKELGICPHPIAVFGANSVLAQDFLECTSLELSRFLGFVRSPERFPDSRVKLLDYSQFRNSGPYAAILNFVGFGSPARVGADSGLILEITRKFDFLALEYMVVNPSIPYIFISSGSVYNLKDKFSIEDASTLSASALKSEDFYPYAKFEAECRHRQEPHLRITDIRVFNYVSRRQSVGDGFLFTDALRALSEGTQLVTSPSDIFRDYSSKSSLTSLIELMLEARTNLSLDLFTKRPISKFELLENLTKEFGLRVTVDSALEIDSPTGVKKDYVPRSFRAREFGYDPSNSSLENVISVVRDFKQSLQF